MSAAADTSALVGGPIQRYGGKGILAPRLLPHFARARLYLEPFFGAGGMFYAVPPGLYERAAVNDIDASIVTFFRVLRTRTEELIAACEGSPCARDEFGACIPRADDDLEEARRVWVRCRQGFSGTFGSIGRWGRHTDLGSGWAPRATENKLSELRAYAARLRVVQIDSIDGADFVTRWAGPDTFVYADPPYVATSRKGSSYAHEMSDAAHRALAASLHAAVAKGALVAVSGYPSALYDELHDGWRTASFETDPKIGQVGRAKGRRRTEVLWMSYGVERELQWRGPERQLSLLAEGGR